MTHHWLITGGGQAFPECNMPCTYKWPIRRRYTYFWLFPYFKTNRAGWQLGRAVMVAEDAQSKELLHTIKLLDLGKRCNVHLWEIFSFLF